MINEEKIMNLISQAHMIMIKDSLSYVQQRGLDLISDLGTTIIQEIKKQSPDKATGTAPELKAVSSETQP